MFVYMCVYVFAAPVSEAVQDYRRHLEQYGQRKKSQIKKKGSSRESQAIALLEKFSNRLKKASSGQDDGAASLAQVADYSEEETEKTKDVAVDEKANSSEDDCGWRSHSLVSESTGPRLAKDASSITEDTYDISDPRHPINKRRRKAQKQREQSKGYRH
eukprot:scpid99303/ scgid1553/ Peptidyl-prolyl cis-trans isomerase CWC27 homolog; Antigen NY-CO-10; Serologically defined colon cancer antigen 10